MRRPAQGATGDWVMPGLTLQWFPLCEFSLFDTPRVSSLVVKGLAVNALAPKAQGLILSFAWVYIFFSAGQYSCPLLAGFLHALLCLKVYSWCIHGERCIPSPSTPLPSCSSSTVLKWHIYSYMLWFSASYLLCISGTFGHAEVYLNLCMGWLTLFMSCWVPCHTL